MAKTSNTPSGKREVAGPKAVDQIRSRRRVALGIRTFLVAAVVVSLASCSAHSAPLAATSSPHVAKSAPSKPTPTPIPPLASWVSATTVTDENGYAVKFKLSHALASFQTSTASDKPGQMSVTFGVRDTLSITNVTAGHNVSFGQPETNGNPPSTVTLLAVWGPSSTICKTYASRLYTSLTASQADCFTQLSAGYITSPLAAGQTEKVAMIPGQPDEEGTQSKALPGIGGFPTASWPAIKSELAVPDEYALVYAYSEEDPLRFAGVCPSLGIGLDQLFGINGAAFIASRSGQCGLLGQTYSYTSTLVPVQWPTQ